MRKRYGTRRWHTVIAAAVSTALACAVAGTVPVAFAQEDDANGSDDVESAESAFRLGHVAIECVDADAVAREGSSGSSAVEEEDAEQGELQGALQGCELAMGESVLRSYRIVNQGEEAYIRIASHTVLGSLDHTNDAGVIEGEALTAVEWRLAQDGYWYRSVPLRAEEDITVQLAVEIPFEKEWVEALKTGQPSMVEETIGVEALQSRNKTVDLSSKDPWGMRGRTAQEMEATDGNGGA